MHENKEHKTGLYERSVKYITELVKPHLHDVTNDFIEKSVDENAQGNPHYAKIIAFEIRRRGDGAGLTQDVAEPLIWTGFKTVAALGIAAITGTLGAAKNKVIGYGAAAAIMLNNGIELLRLIPRYKAGLQGSLEMAKDRWEHIERTGVDPFNSQAHQLPSPLSMHSGDAWQARTIASRSHENTELPPR